MTSFTIMNSRERKRVLERLEEQFGCDAAFLKEFVFLFRERDGHVNIITRAAGEELAQDAYKVDAAGLYFCTLMDDAIRMSVEGSQLLGPHATKNVLTLTDDEFKEWIRGRAVEKATELHGFVLVKHKDDFCGCGKPVRDEKSGAISLHNYIPKTRYVRSED